MQYATIAWAWPPFAGIRTEIVDFGPVEQRERRDLRPYPLIAADGVD